MPTELGPFAPIASYIPAVLGGGYAFVRCYLIDPDKDWSELETFRPTNRRRATVLLVGVALALAVSFLNHRLDLTLLAWLSGIGAVLSFASYIWMTLGRGLWIVQVPSGEKGRPVLLFRGVLTEKAAQFASEKEASLRDVMAAFHFDPESIWEEKSRRTSMSSYFLVSLSFTIVSSLALVFICQVVLLANST